MIAKVIKTQFDQERHISQYPENFLRKVAYATVDFCISKNGVWIQKIPKKEMRFKQRIPKKKGLVLVQILSLKQRIKTHLKF